MGIRERLRILSVEPDPAVGGALRDIIEEILPPGSEIDITPSIRDALARLKSGIIYDLLTTCNYPVDGKGIDLVHQVRGVEGYERTPIIAITGTEGGIVTEQFRQAGVFLILSKPVTDTQLQDAIYRSILPKKNGT